MEMWKKLLHRLVLPNLTTMASQPYHNLHHMLYVKSMIDDAEVYYSKNSIDFEALKAAAIVHDIGHSGGALTDDINVNVAIQLVKNSNLLNEDEESRVIALISNTQYPYVESENGFSLERKIIRDADVMMCYHPEYFRNVFIPLAIEMKIETTTDSLLKFVKTQNDFITGREWCSRWGYDSWNKNKSIFHGNILKVIDILEN